MAETNAEKSLSNPVDFTRLRRKPEIMGGRLVLGCGTVGRQVVDQLAVGHDPSSLLVITHDEATADALRDENVPSRTGDPTDPATFDDLAEPAVIFIGGDRTDTNRRALEVARDQFPASSITAYLGGNPCVDDRDRFESLADYVIDPDAALAERLRQETVGRPAEAARLLRHHLQAIDGRLAVIAHENPDPDAIASAVALVEVATHLGVEAEACYFGEISHQENRALVNVLELKLRQLDPDEELSEFAGFALVDHSRPGINNGLPSDLDIDVVIDHHPPRGPLSARYVDLREFAGATSTILTEYVTQFDIEVTPETATALLYGIRTDTSNFTREVSSADFEAASVLWPLADSASLSQIEAPTIDGETFETIARAIKNRVQEGSVAVASVGELGNRDAVPQAADQLLTMEGVETTLVFGLVEEMVYLSARSRAPEVDLGETLRDAFARIGSAGGHADMAGAQLEVGILANVEDEAEADSIVSVVEEVITKRFFEAIQTHSGTPVGAYTQTSQWLFGEPEDANPV